MPNTVVLENRLEPILSGQAGIHKVAPEVIPFTQAPIVESLQVIRDNEGNNIVSKAFLKKKQPPYSTIAILERMNAFESDMKLNKVIKSF